MGTDARVRYTKMVIKQSFAALLEKKPLNKITVKELCESAETNRAAFYRYYRDTYDLMENLEREFLEELLDATREPGKRSFRETLVRMLREIEKTTGCTGSCSPRTGTRISQTVFLTCATRTAP